MTPMIEIGTRYRMVATRLRFYLLSLIRLCILPDCKSRGLAFCRNPPASGRAMSFADRVGADELMGELRLRKFFYRGAAGPANAANSERAGPGVREGREGGC